MIVPRGYNTKFSQKNNERSCIYRKNSTMGSSLMISIVNNVDLCAEVIERDAWLDLFSAAPDQARSDLGLSHETIAGMGLLGCRAIPITELNRALAVGIEREPLIDDLDAATSWLDDHAASWALQIAPGARTPILQDHLARSSLAEAGMGWAKFVATDAPRRRDPLVEPVPVEVVDDEGADAFGRAVVEGFGLPAACGAWFAALVGRPSWRCFAAIVDGEVAGCGSMFVRNGAAWLGVEATRPTFRGRGAQRSVVAAQVSAAAAMGATVLTCETSQPADHADEGATSYRNQERAGFLRRYTRPNFKRSA
ncbi:GNAT family N-acetyltransferase [Methylobacterium frigidaeris]|nr:GNAT family N-acetyltransferase [Methylobacterium frigidaeris]